MILSLLVVLAVSILSAFVLDRNVRMRLALRQRTTFDGRILSPRQISARELLRRVVWLWRYGYLPPEPFSRSQRITLGLTMAVSVFAVLTLIIWLMLRFVL